MKETKMPKPAPTLIPPVKTGVKTSEFWLTVVTSALALLAAFGVIGPNWAHMHEQAVQAMAFLVGTGAPGVYALSRGLTKRGHQLAVARVVEKAVIPETITVRAATPSSPPAPTADITVTASAPAAPSSPTGDTSTL